MARRSERLHHLLEVQHQLKAVHEMRRSAHLAEARAAAADAESMLSRPMTSDSLADLFPDVYARFVERARERQAMCEAQAAVEARHIAVQTIRADRIKAHHRAALQAEQRSDEERDMLDAVERALLRASSGKPAAS